MKKFRRLSFKGVPNELKDPAQQEQGSRHNPEEVIKKSGDSHCERDKDRRNAVSVAKAVHRMLMATGVLRDPLFAAASAYHYCG